MFNERNLTPKPLRIIFLQFSRQDAKTQSLDKKRCPGDFAALRELVKEHSYYSPDEFRQFRPKGQFPERL
jgi:hypothetical protein